MHRGICITIFILSAFMMPWWVSAMLGLLYLWYFNYSFELLMWSMWVSSLQSNPSLIIPCIALVLTLGVPFSKPLFRGYEQTRYT